MWLAQLCPILCDPMNHSPPGSSVHGTLQERILERVSIPFSRGSFQPRDQTLVSCIAGRFLPSEPKGKDICRDLPGKQKALPPNRNDIEWLLYCQYSFFFNHCRKLFQTDKSKTIRVEMEIRSFLVKACKIAFRKQNHLPFASLPIVSLALDLFFFFFGLRS